MSFKKVSDYKKRGVFTQQSSKELLLSDSPDYWLVHLDKVQWTKELIETWLFIQQSKEFQTLKEVLLSSGVKIGVQVIGNLFRSASKIMVDGETADWWFDAILSDPSIGPLLNLRKWIKFYQTYIALENISIASMMRWKRRWDANPYTHNIRDFIRGIDFMSNEDTATRDQWLYSVKVGNERPLELMVVFSRAPRTTQPLFVFRGLRYPLARVTFPISTTWNMNIAQKFADQSDSINRIILVIRVPVGVPFLVLDYIDEESHKFHDNNNAEDEVLVPSMADLVIVEDTERKEEFKKQMEAQVGVNSIPWHNWYTYVFIDFLFLGLGMSDEAKAGEGGPVRYLKKYEYAKQPIVKPPIPLWSMRKQ